MFIYYNLVHDRRQCRLNHVISLMQGQLRKVGTMEVGHADHQHYDSQEIAGHGIVVAVQRLVDCHGDKRNCKYE